jgi:hypothetical protein
MFRWKKKDQIRSVEEFLKSQGTEPPPVADSGPGDKKTVKPGTKKWFIAPAVVAGGFLVLLFAAFAKIDGLEADIGRLKLRDGGTTEGLKLQVAALGARIDKSDKYAEQLRADIARLEKDMEALKVAAAQKRKVEALVRKTPVAEKKKPAKPPKHKAARSA